MKIPPGYALVRLDDLAALLAARTAPEPQPQTGHAGEQHATMAGLAEAIALVTARRHGIGTGLSGDVPAPAVAAALTILAAAFLGGLGLEDQGARLLQDIGLTAARDDGGPTGRTTAP